jgi:hypothetical protein
LRYRVNSNWPIGAAVVPGGFIVDRANNDFLTQLALPKIPPPDAVPLDVGAANLLRAVYQPTPVGWNTICQVPTPDPNNF